MMQIAIPAKLVPDLDRGAGIQILEFMANVHLCGDIIQKSK